MSSVQFFNPNALRSVFFGQHPTHEMRKLFPHFSSFLSLSTCWKILMDLFFGNFMFILTFPSVVRIFPSTSISITRCKYFLLAILISSYFKISLIAVMVCEFPSVVIFIIDLFVLSSNIVALKVMTESATSKQKGFLIRLES